MSFCLDSGVQAKRVVLITSNAPPRILGLVTGPPIDFVQAVTPFGLIQASLIQVRHRMVVYRELMIPVTGRLGVFHPGQL